MKKGTFILVVALLGLFSVVIGYELGEIAGTPSPTYGYVKNESYYPEAYVVLRRQDNGYCHLSNGIDGRHEWVVYAEDFIEGDIVACMMGDMGTPDDRIDDRMLYHYYSGWNILTDTGCLDDYLP